MLRPLAPIPPMSNTERQRKFRASHPGYFRKYKPRRNANQQAIRTWTAALAAAQAAETAAAAATAASIETPPARLALPAPPVRLALPAPVEPLEFPALNPAVAKSARQPLAA